MMPCAECRREAWDQYRALGEAVARAMAGAVCYTKHGWEAKL